MKKTLAFLTMAFFASCGVTTPMEDLQMLKDKFPKNKSVYRFKNTINDYIVVDSAGDVYHIVVGVHGNIENRLEISKGK